MKLNARLLGVAIVAAAALGCGDNDAEETPGADSHGVDTGAVSAPLDTTSALDSINAPVGRDSIGNDTATVSKPAPKSDTVGTDNRGAVNTTPDTGASGAGGVGSGMRRGESNAGASGRRIIVAEGDTGSAGARRR
jgi:hypothetical protein